MMRRIEHQDEAITGEEKAREYSEIHKKYAKFSYGPFLKDMKKLDITGSCLEIGAGPAIMTCMFAQYNPEIHITAVDLSPDMIAVGKENIASKGLSNRIDYFLCDVTDRSAMENLGAFDCVYSIGAMHHWSDLQGSIVNLLVAAKNGGMLYIGDMKRVWWLYYLPSNNGDIQSVRAAYRPREIRDILRKLGIESYSIRTLFPFFIQSVIVRK
jgi:SAM-dependent methyltransferase